MKEYVDGTMTEQERLLLADGQFEEDEELGRVRTQDTLLIDDTYSERTVGLLYLLTLTCGVGG